MGLYERIAGTERPRLPVHTLMSALQEFALGNMSAPQAAAALNLSAPEQTDAAALRDRILAETNANATTQGILRRLKALEIEQVLILLSVQAAPFNTTAAVKARIGVT